eukprot:Skav217413  [mRNA]  locus=scaffold2674:357934:368154:+ [translate_table: standard]
MPSHYYDLVKTLDVVGQREGLLHSTQRNLMVTIDERRLDDQQIILMASTHIPEGFGSGALGKANVLVSPDAPFLANQKIIWDTADSLPPLGRKLWFLDVHEYDCTVDDPAFLEMCYRFTPTSTWVEVPVTFQDDAELSSIRTVELFAGGFGGWKSSWNIASQFLSKSVCSLAIENNVDIAKNYAIAQSATFVPDSANLDDYDFAEGNWIVQKTIGTPEVKKLVTRFSPHVVTISSPCPPWSTASRGEGLETTEGMLLPEAIGMMKWARPTILLLEQVAGFRYHEHFSLVCKLLKLLGYDLLWHKVVDLAQQAQPSRPRWLGLAVRIQACIRVCPFQMWPSTTTWGSCKLQLPREQLDQLYLTDEIAEVAGNFRYVKNPGPNMSRHAADVIAHRIYDACDQLPTFMARYGTQHEFSSAYLAEYGYFGFFLKDTGPAVGCRFFSPAEIAVMHGIWNSTALPLTLRDAWLIIGNQIAIPHGLLMVGNACRFLGIDLEIRELFHFYHEHKVVAHDSFIHTIPGGYLITKAADTIPDEFHDVVADLWGHGRFTPQEFWSPQHGICTVTPVADPEQVAPSAVTPETASENEEVTGGSTMLMAHVQFDDHHQEFWFSPALRVGDLEWIWEHMFQATFQLDAVPALRFHRTEQITPTVHQRCILVTSIEGKVVVIAADPDRSLLEQSHEIGLPARLFDPFSHIGMYVAPDQVSCLVDFELPLQNLTQDVLLVTCAFSMTKQTYAWDPRTDVLELYVESDDATAQATITHAIAEALNTQALQLLGRSCDYMDTPGMLQFRPTRTVGVLPVKQFKWMLAVATTKMMLNALAKTGNPHEIPENQRKVVLMLQHRKLWQGTLHADNTLRSLEFLIRKCLAPILETRRLRVKVGMQMIDLDLTLRHTDYSVLHDAVVLDLSPELTGGGGKTQARTLQQTALASALLDKGYPLTWVTKSVDKLVNKFAIQKLQAATALPVGSQRTRAIEDLCQEADIDIPAVQPPVSRAKQAGLPWNKPKKARIDALHFDVTSYTILEGFFSNMDGSDVQQILEMRPQSSGICLMQQQQAAPWVTAAATISPDELAILVPGKMEVPSSLQSVALTFPCLNNAREMVLLQGTLIQLGAKAIKYKQGVQNQLPASGHLVAFTLHRDDWNDNDWQRALDQTAAFLKERLAQDGLDKEIQALWGKALRANGSPASPLQATTVQMHGTIESAKLTKLLQCSGFNRIFVIPKSPEGRIMDTYRVIWLTGDVTHATCVSAQLTDCLGLIRGKADSNFGLRFAADRFEAAWKHVYPSTPVPKAATGGQVWKLEGLPFGCTNSSLQQWLVSISWDAVPLKALGPTTWLFKSEVDIPAGIHLYNSTPVLARKLPPRAAPSERILLGRPSKPTGKDPWQHGSDPWVGFRPTTTPSAPAMSAPRPLQGPVEAKFQAQEEKLQTLQSELAALSKNCDARTQELQSQMVHLEKTQQAQQQDVHRALGQMKQDFDSALASNLKVHSTRMDDKFDELKQLMMKVAKRSKPETGEDEDMEGLSLSVIDQGIWGSDHHFAMAEFGNSSALLPLPSYRLHGSHALHMPRKSGPDAIRSMFQCVTQWLSDDHTSDDFSLDFSGIFPNMCTHAFPIPVQRYGEASHPGPHETKRHIRMAITNPTSIFSKADVYQEITNTFALDVIACAETSATAVAQRSFTKAIRQVMPYQTWSPPVQDHVARSDGAPSKKGRAGGTALFSNLPHRAAIATLAPEWEATTRVTHSVLSVNQVQLQLLVIYGLPMNRPGATKFNSELIHAALDAAAQLPIPTVLLGDFNGNPMLWDCGERLKQQGFLGIDTKHVQLYGEEMPHTCKDATTIDLAYVSLQAHQWISRIHVEAEPYFDAHKIVLIDLTIPTQDIELKRYVMPRTFADIDVDATLWGQTYQTLHDDDPPATLTQWAGQVEGALDATLRKQHATEPWMPLGLPVRYKGRCKPLPLRQVSMHTLTKQARPGDYKPGVEVHSRQTQQMVRQCRRLESLQRILNRTHMLAKHWDTASKDWKAILQCKAFGPDFLCWCGQHIALGPVSAFCPTHDQTQAIAQLARCHTDAALQRDKQAWLAKLEFDRQLDLRKRGHSKAFARLKATTTAPLQYLGKSCEELAIVHQQSDGTLLLYLAHADQFFHRHSIQIDGQPATIQCSDAWSMIVQPNVTDYDWPMEALAVIALTIEYANMCGMTVDWKKSWGWATHASHLAQLKAILQKHPATAQVICKSNATDLGVHHTYSGSPKLGKTHERLRMAHTRLSELQTMPHSLSAKVHLVQSGIYALAFYGAEVLPLGCSHTDGIRTKVCDALLGVSASRNSFVTMACVPGLLDPELYVIKAAILAAKRYLLKATPDDEHRFLRLVTQHTGVTTQCRGPAGALRHYLNRLDWQLDSQGNLQVGTFQWVPLKMLSSRRLTSLLQEAWCADLFCLHTSRKAWKGLPPIHAMETQRLIATLEDHHQRAILNEIGGAFQTSSQKAKWDETQSPSCPYCTAEDTREHRIWHCPATQHVREHHQDLLRTLQEEGCEYHEMPVLYRDHRVDFYRLMCDFVPEPVMDETLQTRLRDLGDRGHMLRFYTDGSCIHPTLPDVSYAGFAVVVDLAFNDAERAQMASTWDPLLATATLKTLIAVRIAGEQNIHRAEISALLYVCQHVRRAELVSDSGVALALAHRCQMIQHPRELYLHTEADLALPLWEAIQQGTFRFRHVKAHQDVETTTDLQLKYDQIGNAQADGGAQFACLHTHRRLADEMDLLAQQMQHSRDMLAQYYSYFLELQCDRAKLKKQTHQLDTHEPQAAPQQTVCDKLCRYEVAAAWPMPVPTVDHRRDFAWGPTWAGILVDWMGTLRWPVNPREVEHSDLGITWIELAMSLMVFAQMWLPLRRPLQHGQERLVVFDDHTHLSAYQVRFSEFADTTQQMFRQMSTLRDTLCYPEMARQLVRSTYQQGFTIHSSGLATRCQLPNQEVILPILRDHVAQYPGPAWSVVPELPLGTSDKLQMVRRETSRAWGELCRASQKSATALRTTSRLKLRQITFH